VIVSVSVSVCVCVCVCVCAPNRMRPDCGGNSHPTPDTFSQEEMRCNHKRAVSL
jgi:hypothetical protein